MTDFSKFTKGDYDAFDPKDEVELEAAKEAWIASRPPVVRDLARRFPAGSAVMIRGKQFYIIGYTDDDMLLVSETDPFQDYDKAVLSKECVCAKHLVEMVP
jgi:hypothetical protein